MPGLGTVKILIDADTLADMIRDDHYIKHGTYTHAEEIRTKLDAIIPHDAVLMEIRPMEREPDKLMMVWCHPSFPSEPIVHDSPEPKIPESWDYIK